ncbi:hypothetical protein [Salmonella enterica]|uniref:hypothetical protein n=1 Tax=Salmonella enterica TaxID=28901 RepID=UPI0009AC7B62|nr:hypothetical protein [Salmonella enterica]
MMEKELNVSTISTLVCLIILLTGLLFVSRCAVAISTSQLQCLQVLSNGGNIPPASARGDGASITSTYSIDKGYVPSLREVVNRGYASYGNFMVAYDRNISLRHNSTGTVYSTTATFDIRSESYTPYGYTTGGRYVFGSTLTGIGRIFCESSGTYQDMMRGTITFTLPAGVPAGTFTVTIPARKIYATSNSDILTSGGVYELLNTYGILYYETLSLTLTSACNILTPDLSVEFGSVRASDLLAGGISKNMAFRMSCDVPVSASLKLTHNLAETGGTTFQLKDPARNLTATVGFIPSSGTAVWNNGTYTVNMSVPTLNASLPVVLKSTDDSKSVSTGYANYTIMGILSVQ